MNSKTILIEDLIEEIPGNSEESTVLEEIPTKIEKSTVLEEISSDTNQDIVF